MIRRRTDARRAMTLLEVVISIALIAMLLSSLLTFCWQTLEIRDQAIAVSDRTQIVQQVLHHIGEELRGCVGLEAVAFPITVFEGERRRVTFVTAPLPSSDSYTVYTESDRAPAAKQDLREITYELWVDPEETTDDGEPLVAGIVRTERRAIDPYLTEEEVPEGEELLHIHRDLWSPELGYLEFRYFDGVEWSTTWNVTQGNPLPHLIQITVGFDSILTDELEDSDLEEYPIDNDHYPLGPDIPNPDRYSLIVKLRAADQTFASRLYRLGDEMQETYGFNLPMEGEEGELLPEGEEGLD